MKPSELLLKYGSDKCCQPGNSLHHNYAEFYDEVLGRMTNVKSVLEIGIMHGQSLRAWEELFPEAFITGIDNQKDLCFSKGRISCIHVDTTERDKFLEICEMLPEFDIIIDDGSHVPTEQLWAFGCLWQNVRKGGVYIIEDIPHPKYFRLFRAAGAMCFDCRRTRGCQDDLIASWRKPS